MLGDLARFATASVLVTLAGVGVTTCLRTKLTATERLLVGPAFGLALWAIAIGKSVEWHFTLKVAVPWVWAVTLALSAIGSSWLVRSRRTTSADSGWRGFVLISAVLAPIVTMAPWFWRGLDDYPGSGMPDGWSYVAYGQYLWDYGLDATRGLAPIYQFATTLVSTRNIAAGDLGLLSWFRHAGETASALGLVQAIGLMAYSAAVGALALRLGLGRAAAPVAVLITTFSAWTLNALWANNFDNVLALSYAPTLAVLAARPDIDSGGWWLGVVWIAAGLFQTYADMAIAVLACAALNAIIVLPRGSRRPVSARVVWIVAALLLFVAVIPPLREMTGMLRVHFSVATSSTDPRPGEGLFLGLTTARHALAAWWALASEHRYEPLLVARTIAGAALFSLLAIGAWTSRRVVERGALTWLIMPLVAAPVLAVVESYAYGAYKAILMGWWLEVILVIRAASVLAGCGTRSPAFIAACVVAAVLPATAAARLVAPVSRTFRMPRPVSMATFRQVQDVRSLVGAGPILIAMRDEEATEWALYYLRDLPAAVFTNHRYLVPKAAAMSHAGRVNVADIRWVLADAPGTGGAGHTDLTARWTLRWREGPYALWQTPPGEGRSLIRDFALVSN